VVVAGLTGGIASGKSFVSSLFASYGAGVVDADVIAREVVKSGSKAWQLIREQFGESVLLEDGSINRDLLGSIIFSDPEKKAQLNGLVHPAVIEEMEVSLREMLSSGRYGLVICDVPLLIETGMYRDYREIILVSVPREIQIQRLMLRDRISQEDAMMKISSQMALDDKKRYATILIDNSGSREETAEKALAAYEYLSRQHVRK